MKYIAPVFPLKAHRTTSQPEIDFLNAPNPIFDIGVCSYTDLRTLRLDFLSFGTYTHLMPVFFLECVVVVYSCAH